MGGFGGGEIVESARLDDAKCRVKSTHIFGFRNLLARQSICRTVTALPGVFTGERFYRTLTSFIIMIIIKAGCDCVGVGRFVD